MNYDERFNLFLISKSDMERRYICNYRKNSTEKTLIEYSCFHNLYSWIKLINIYSEDDILEYYSKCYNLKLDIFKLLLIDYKSLYLQNVVLNSCNSEVIEFLLKFDNENYFSFNILIETSKSNILKLFINNGYRIQNYEIEMMIMKNLVFSSLFEKIKDWIYYEKKNLYYIFKYCNSVELIEYLSISYVDLKSKDELQKDVFMYLCENQHINLKLIITVLKNLDLDVNREDLSGNNALYYYCFNVNFCQNIYNFLLKLGLKLEEYHIKKILELNKNPKVFANFESYDLIPFKYDIELLSQDLETLKYFEKKYKLYNFIDLGNLIFNIIEIGSFDCLKFILQKYPDHIDLQDNYENSLLDIICSNPYKNLDIIQFLVEKGINVYNKNIFGYNSIFNLLNSEKADIEIFKYFISFEKIEFTYNNNFENLYHILCKLNYNISYLNLVSKYNININLLDKYKNTALNYALYNNNLDNVNFFFSKFNVDLTTKNKLGFNSLDYLLKSKIVSYKLLLKFKNVTLNNLENYISTNNLNIKIFAYLLGKLKNKYKSNDEGNNILLLICKTNMNNTKLKLKLLEILKYNKFNFNKCNYNNENALILTMKYEPNYYIVKYLIDLKVSTFKRDNYGNNALIYSKDIKIYNLLQKYSIVRNNNLGQNILIRLFNINYLDHFLIKELSNNFCLQDHDNLNKTILDYYIENNNNDIELFDFILQFTTLKKKHINYILRSRNNKLCLYLLHKKKIDPNYLDNNNYGLLDYFSFDLEIINFLKNKYIHKIKNNNIDIIDETLLVFINNINEHVLKIEDINLKKKVILDNKLNNETIFKLLEDESLLKTILSSKNKLDNFYYKSDNILIIILKYKYSLNYIKFLINEIEVDINYVNCEKRNILYYCYYDLNIFKYFVTLGCDYNINDYNFESILFNYVKNNYNKSTIEFLVKEYKMNVNHLNINGLSMIFKTTNNDVIKILLDNGLSKHCRDFSGNTYLNYYMQQNNISINIINLLIKYKFNFDTINNNNRTPLLNYLRNNEEIYIVSIILKYQNSINLKDISGDTALLLVIKKSCNQQIVHLLLQSNANPNILDNYSRNCLYYCNNDSFLPIIKDLINYKIDYNLVIEYRTYLLYYIWWGMENTVKYLLKNFKDIDINFTDTLGNNALFYAAGIYSEQGNLDIIKYLHQKGVNIKHINNDGHTLLYIAAGVSGYNYFDDDILKYFLNYIDINHLDNESNSFLNYLDEDFFENLVVNNILNNKEPIVLEIIYSKNFINIMPYELEFEYLDMKNNTCGVCLDNFESGDILNKCQNNHTFHRDCLIKWYKESKKLKCTYCTLKFVLNQKAIKCL